jgi:hypothetical protein
MANELLDFVMSLVRDPDAYARYAADPSQAISDAHLTDVTSADVNGLIPVVSESLSMGTPMPGADAGVDSNVWASGAATAAFDAFSDHVPDHVPARVIDDAHDLVGNVVDQPVDHTALDVGAGLDTVDAGSVDHAAMVDDFHIDDSAPAFDTTTPVDHLPLDDHHFGTDASGFDVFE